MRLLLASLLFAAFPIHLGWAQGATFEPIGVPECDAFIARWNQCRMKKQANERLAMDENVRQLRSGWVQQASRNRSMVAYSCKQSTDMFFSGPECE